MTNLIVNTGNNKAQTGNSNPLLNKVVEATKKAAVPIAAKKEPPVPKSTVNLQTPPNDIGLYNNQGIVKANKPETVCAPKTSTEEPIAPKNALTNFVADGGQIIVDIKNSDSGYDNKIYWSSDNFKTKNYLGIDNQTGTYNLGTFDKGTKIDFAIDNGNGGFYRTGTAADNPDNFVHAQVTTNSSGTQIGFEDLNGGGDNDFNDAIIQISSLAIPKETKDTKDTKETKDNRSGLGDGTNPGQGDGKINSPNQGTLNPNNTDASNRNVLTGAALKSASATQAAAVLAATVSTPAKIALAPVKIDDTKAKEPVVAATKAKEPVVAATKAKEPAVVATKAKEPAVVATKAKEPAVVATKAKEPAVVATKAKESVVVDTKATVVAAAPKSESAKTNSSGLLDGTNPGKGAGTANSPNTGVNNPNAVTSVDIKLMKSILVK
jgi:hypothetical protein